jgi:membrane protein DedA with SNARE-associated domain
VSGELLVLLTSYGLPALFLILLVTSAGAPFPDSLLLVAVGSFVAQGDLDFVPVVVVGTLGAVAGDQVGYALGYWGGRPLAAKVAGAERIAKAEAFSRKWGGPGVFFSRWLIGPLGPWINITSGMTVYPWARFVLLDVAGELIWVVLYVSLGRLFSDKVQAIADLLGNLSWVVLGITVTSLLGWKIWKGLARSRESSGSGDGQEAVG